eukprot:TRINITY_DN5955_c0_g1_i5.p1 TRINITY_DN5955_c0_g1~~TRINITY_DN5955_c0_g1_i5.p1  ORF type:complete len:563 (-),score=190.24 TRINITY_DN5955_c0_g1_i5:140-1828(-)
MYHPNIYYFSQYCARRIGRTRHALQFTQSGSGKGASANKFTAKIVSPDDCRRDARFLTIPLFNAERAWGYAMAIKQDANVNGATHRLVHLRRKLAKAAKWASMLKDLCGVVADTKTALEAEAYATLMNATWHLEANHLSDALKFLNMSNSLFNSLLMIGASEHRALYNARLEQIRTSISVCEYIGSNSSKDAKNLDLDSMDDILRAKIDTVLEESRHRQAQALETLQWGKLKIPIKDEKVRLNILKIGEQMEQYKSYAANEEKNEISELSREKQETLLNQTVVVYDETEAMIVNQIQKSKSLANRDAIVEEDEIHLSNLLKYLEFNKLLSIAQRNDIIASQLEASLLSKSKASKGGSGLRRVKAVKHDDVVNIYDRSVQALQDAAKHKESVKDPKFFSALEQQEAFYKAKRVFFRAEGYASIHKWAEAFALYHRTIEYGLLVKSGKYAAAAQELVESARSKKLLVHAHAYISLDAEKSLAENPEDVVGDDESGGKTYLLDRLDKFVCPKGSPQNPYNLVEFPPNYVAAPCKPVLFDLAWSFVNYPDVSAKVQKKKGKWFGIW